MLGSLIRWLFGIPRPGSLVLRVGSTHAIGTCGCDVEFDGTNESRRLCEYHLRCRDRGISPEQEYRFHCVLPRELEKLREASEKSGLSIARMKSLSQHANLLDREARELSKLNWEGL